MGGEEEGLFDVLRFDLAHQMVEGFGRLAHVIPSLCQTLVAVHIGLRLQLP